MIKVAMKVAMPIAMPIGLLFDTMHKIRRFGLLLLFSAGLHAEIPPDVTLDPIPGISGLIDPLGIKHAGDGSGRLFIVEQSGRIRVLKDDALLSTPLVELGNLVTNAGFEQGLLDIAFHPQFALNGRFYLHYSAGSERPAGTSPGDTIVGEFTITDDPNVANNVPDRIILTVTQDFGNHNGGQMRFDPDGYLYLGLGDGGSGNDPCNRAQTLNPADLVDPASCTSSASLDDSLALLGKMLRVDVDNPTPFGANNLCAADPDGSANYAIPSDNPFFGQADRCGEVLLYGLRNPWRWSFDRQTMDMWIGDVGQNTWEEVDLLPWSLASGDNLGWKICEGSFLRGSFDAEDACDDPSTVLPVLEYRTGQNGNCSVTGGYRYRGPVTSLRGRYIYSDFCSGRIWFAEPDNGGWSEEVFGLAGGNVRSLGEDEEGQLYLLSGQSLLRFNGNLELLFTDGFESP